jgi:protein phosphatase
MKLAGKTNIGRIRKENQDDFRAADLPGSAAWGLVCDGMGGARGGKEASCTACDVIEHSFQDQYSQCIPGEEKRFLENALKSANHCVFQKSIHNESLAGMGTTAVCALVRGGRAHLCHAGDSRAYLLHAGQLTQLTHDHSYVQELVDCGTITVQEAENHPQKNIITRALGVDMRVQPEYSSTVMLPGDLLLLCTDGLSNAVPTAQMEAILTEYDFYDVPDRLIEAANAGGGQDNITALLMEMEPTEVKHG